MAVPHRLLQPHMPPHVDLHRAVERADPALDTTSRLRHDPCRRQSVKLSFVGPEPAQRAHRRPFEGANDRSTAASAHRRPNAMWARRLAQHSCFIKRTPFGSRVQASRSTFWLTFWHSLLTDAGQSPTGAVQVSALLRIGWQRANVGERGGDPTLGVRFTPSDLPRPSRASKGSPAAPPARRRRPDTWRARSHPGQVAKKLLDLRETRGSHSAGGTGLCTQMNPNWPQTHPNSTREYAFRKPVLYPLSYEGTGAS